MADYTIAIGNLETYPLAEKTVKQRRPYRSYLLRLWQESTGSASGGEPALWRASLERPQDGERLGFASLVDLFAFLESETVSGSPASGPVTAQKGESGGGR